jgi:hypothetical protein
MLSVRTDLLRVIDPGSSGGVAGMLTDRDTAIIKDDYPSLMIDMVKMALLEHWYASAEQTNT